jgi:diacylglycerol kinase family enzyme
MRVVLVDNPKAGSADGSVDSLIGQIRALGHSVEHLSSKDPWHQALQENPDLVAVVGGDGTVAEVARALAGGSVPLAVLPMGTANNIAMALGVAKTPLEELIAGWDSAARCAFDVGVARGPWGTFRFLESVGAGLLSETMAAIDHGNANYVNDIEDPRQRIEAALDVCRRTLVQLEACRFEISIDGRDLSGEYLMVEALNFGAAGPNLQLSRYGDASDGVLDVVLAADGHRSRLLHWLTSTAADASLAPELATYKGREVRLRRCGPGTLHLDDELWTGERGAADAAIELSIEPKALTFLVPPRGSGGGGGGGS